MGGHTEGIDRVAFGIQRVMRTCCNVRLCSRLRWPVNFARSGGGNVGTAYSGIVYSGVPQDSAVARCCLLLPVDAAAVEERLVRLESPGRQVRRAMVERLRSR